MTLKHLPIDRKALTLGGVKFPDLIALDSTATALASQAFEGFEPTPKLIEVYRDYRMGKFPKSQLLAQIKNAI